MTWEAQLGGKIFACRWESWGQLASKNASLLEPTYVTMTLRTLEGVTWLQIVKNPRAGRMPLLAFGPIQADQTSVNLGRKRMGECEVNIC